MGLCRQAAPLGLQSAPASLMCLVPGPASVSPPPCGGSRSGRLNQSPSHLRTPSGEVCPIAEGLEMGTGIPRAIMTVISHTY